MIWPFNKSKSKQEAAKPVVSSRVVRARYDAAQTSIDNSRHWANADALSADAAASSAVRNILRMRARYEVSNNSYAKGIVLTLANDCIGTGPRLQMLTDNPSLNNAVEAAFAKWAKAVRLADKLRTMRMAKATDGEAFAMLTANPKLKSPVKLDVKLVEADRFTNPTVLLGEDLDTDGIRLDRWGNPEAYAVLRQHPGGTRIIGLLNEFDWIPANAVLHWFRADRPGQHRGVGELTPALPLFAQLRRYTLAVLGAAETAADFAAVLYTDGPATETSPTAPEAMDVIELEKRMATVLPESWKLGQIKAEQPTTTHDAFTAKILNEIARCLNMPFNIAAGNSSGYNYASGRLDHQTYYKSIDVERSDAEDDVLDRILDAWIYEAMLTSEFAALRNMQDVEHKWFWPGSEHVDPLKEANAQATRLKSNTTTLAAEYAKSGLDWEYELRQRAKEKALMRELGLTEESNTSDNNGDEDQETIDEEDAASV